MPSFSLCAADFGQVTVPQPAGAGFAQVRPAPREVRRASGYAGGSLGTAGGSDPGETDKAGVAGNPYDSARDR